MAELRDSSLLFSLDSLFAHERDKVEAERRVAEERRRAAVAAEVAAEQQRQIDQARKAEAARERQLADERRFLDEQARLEGIRQAELERARLEAQLKNEADVAARRERHERELRAIAVDARTKRLRFALLGLASLCGLLVFGIVLHQVFGAGPELARLNAAAAAARESETARAAELRRLLDAADQRRQALEREIAGHTHDVPAPVVAPAASATAPKPGRGGRPGRPPGTKITTPCGGDAHDPLNPCLGG